MIQQIQQAFKDYDFQKKYSVNLEQTHLEDNEMQSIYKELATEAKNATLDKIMITLLLMLKWGCI